MHVAFSADFFKIADATSLIILISLDAVSIPDLDIWSSELI